LPGVLFIGFHVLCEVYSPLRRYIETLYLDIAVITVGLPTLLASASIYMVELVGRFRKGLWVGLHLFLILVAFTIPSLFIFIHAWTLYNPQSGPAMGYMLLFYVATSPLWLPTLAVWSWVTAKFVRNSRHGDRP
jgi:hypothetical protein